MNQNKPVPIRKDVQSAQQAPLFGTGTYGPMPAKAPRRTAAPPPRQVHYEDALRHIMDTVISVLKEKGEQWTPEARQDLVSTVYIQAARERRILHDFEDRPK